MIISRTFARIIPTILTLVANRAFSRGKLFKEKVMLTEEEVENGSTTPGKALEISIRHWLENYNLSYEELKAIIDKGHLAQVTGYRMCGLCVFYGFDHNEITCEQKCKVRPVCPDPGSLYYDASWAYKTFERLPAVESYLTCKKAAGAMHDYLCTLRDENDNGTEDRG